MNMNRVNEIIRKHNELLDSMTEEERIDYYAEVGLVVECETRAENDSNVVAHAISRRPRSLTDDYRSLSDLRRGSSSRKSRFRRNDIKIKNQKFKYEKAR